MKMTNQVMLRTSTLSLTLALVLCVVMVSVTRAEPPATIEQESTRIVSPHKAVFTRPPIGAASFSTDAILLGNGDITMAISSTPLPRGSKLRKQSPDKIRFWFNKNDLWKLGGRTHHKLFAVMDFSFNFDRRKGTPKYHVETDLLTATTYGTLSQDDGNTLKFKAWVSAVENMMFIEFTADGKHAMRWNVETELMRAESDWEMDGSDGEGSLFMRREFPKGTPPTGMSMCVEKFGSGRRFEMSKNSPRLFAFTVDSLMKNENYAEDVVKAMDAFAVKDLPAKYEAHKRWWADFWAESFVEIPDKVIEKQYYLANYLLASCCRDKDFPPGIISTWACNDRPGWANDYHLNYNFQAAFYSLFGSNHVELGEVQDQPLLDYMETGRKLAKERLDMPGILYPVGIGPKGMTTWGNDYGQKSNASYGAVNMIFRWKTTHDLDYAKKIYPYFKELTTFWEAYMTFEKEKNRYAIDKDSVHEGSGKDYNSIVSLALARAVFSTAIELSDALDVDEDKHEKWNHILDHLSKYATMQRDGKTIFRYTERGTEFWGGNTLGIQHIYPALGIGLESDPELIEISHNMIDCMQRWFDNNGDNSLFPAAAYVGYKPELIYQKLHEYVSNHYRPNGFRKNKHGMEKLSTIPNTVNMMLCSVHKGVMRLYPAWPKDVDARFANLRQFGAFLVASELKDDVVQYVAITSEKGLPCTIVNPWPGEKVTVHRDGKPAEQLSGKRFTLKTSVGEKILLKPGG